jgi:hypothetical protein
MKSAPPTVSSSSKKLKPLKKPERGSKLTDRSNLNLNTLDASEEKFSTGGLFFINKALNINIHINITPVIICFIFRALQMHGQVHRRLSDNMQAKSARLHTHCHTPAQASEPERHSRRDQARREAQGEREKDNPGS